MTSVNALVTLLEAFFYVFFANKQTDRQTDRQTGTQTQRHRFTLAAHVRGVITGHNIAIMSHQCTGEGSQAIFQSQVTEQAQDLGEVGNVPQVKQFLPITAEQSERARVILSWVFDE